MTQEEMNQVITAAICFGMNNDMSGELHEVKLNNLELQEELQKQKAINDDLRKYSKGESSINRILQSQIDELMNEQQKVTSQNKLFFYSCQSDRPAHGQVCLCIRTQAGIVLEPKHLILAKYNDKAKYWDDPCADVDNDSHDDGLYDYGDFHITYYMPINISDFVCVTKGNINYESFTE